MNSKLKITADLRRRFRLAIKEDLSRGDITSRLVVPKDARGAAHLFARSGGIFAGRPIAAEIFRLMDPAVKIIWKKSDGAAVRKNEWIAEIKGPVRSILSAERLVLNFIGRLSGIATLTQAYVRKVAGKGVQIYDTRKTTPLWRDLEKYAVRAGGGFNHRSSLGDALMIKDAHWQVLGKNEIPEIRGKLHRTIEVHSRGQLDRTLAVWPDVLMLDNWPTREMSKCVREVKRWARKNRLPRPLIEASGGITLANVVPVARTGVDRISVGALTHSVPQLDFSLKLKRVL